MPVRSESRGEVYSAANDQISGRPDLRGDGRHHQRVPWLDDRASIKRFTKELEDVGGTESIYAALITRERHQGGHGSVGRVIYDELGQSEGRDLLDRSTPPWANVRSR